MATNTAARHCVGTIGATADLLHLTDKVMQVEIRNTHATQILYVKPKTGRTAAAALAAATADAAVAAADENIAIAAGERLRVFQSNKRQYTAFSIIASGSSTTYHVSSWDRTE